MSKGLCLSNTNLIAECWPGKCVQLNSWMTGIWLYTKFCLFIRRLQVFLIIICTLFCGAKLLGSQGFKFLSKAQTSQQKVEIWQKKVQSCGRKLLTGKKARQKSPHNLKLSIHYDVVQDIWMLIHWHCSRGCCFTDAYHREKKTYLGLFFCPSSLERPVEILEHPGTGAVSLASVM